MKERMGSKGNSTDCNIRNRNPEAEWKQTNTDNTNNSNKNNSTIQRKYSEMNADDQTVNPFVVLWELPRTPAPSHRSTPRTRDQPLASSIMPTTTTDDDNNNNSDI